MSLCEFIAVCYTLEAHGNGFCSGRIMLIKLNLLCHRHTRFSSPPICQLLEVFPLLPIPNFSPRLSHTSVLMIIRCPVYRQQSNIFNSNEASKHISGCILLHVVWLVHIDTAEPNVKPSAESENRLNRPMFGG